jgi:hypothetical protein
MNLNDEFSKIIDNLERIRKMAESLYNVPLPFNQILSDMYELEREINILLYELIDFRDKYLLEDKKK